MKQKGGSLRNGIGKKGESFDLKVTIYRKFKEYFEDGSYEKLVKYMYRPTDPSSLGLIRFLFVRGLFLWKKGHQAQRKNFGRSRKQTAKRDNSKD